MTRHSSYEHASREPVSRQKFVQLLNSVLAKGLSEEIVRKSRRWKHTIDGSLLADIRLRKAFLLYHLLKKTQDATMLGTSKTKYSTPLGKTCTPLPTVTHPSPYSSGKPKFQNLQEVAETIGKAVQTKKSMQKIISDRQRPHQAKKPGARRRAENQTQRTREETTAGEKTTAQKNGIKNAAADDDDSSSISSGSYCSKESRGSSLDVNFDRIWPESDDEHVDEAASETEVQRANSTEDTHVVTCLCKLMMNQ
ncbi:hypothetical protein E2C01_008515 [Portunus trituberculatus]|uniref:Uncharacterized protein n=1 Tax=Portunus trituberculatus TaxID=210409 RepID=A0A5B7D4P9_PORTR|nr:hypothetical protein [Portunus trituberculatus]